MVDAVTQSLMSVLDAGGVSGSRCDEWAVRDLEQQLDVALPPAYKAFLLLAGQQFGPFEGSHYALDADEGENDFWELQRAGRRIFQRDGHHLPSDAFVFMVHQGYAMRFFLLNDGDDPAVYEYVEGWPPVKQLAPTFSTFLFQEIRQSKELPR
jgi:hypothetical protein